MSQRALGIALGYEDLIDHDVLRGDRMIAVLVGKLRAKRRNCAPVAGKSTPSRFGVGRYVSVRGQQDRPDGSAIAGLSVTLFLDAYEEAPDRVVLDFDATDDPVHGSQEVGFPTNIMTAIATRRFMFAAVATFWRCGGARRTSTGRSVRWRRLRGSWPCCGRAGRTRGSGCGPIRGPRARTLWRGAKRTTSIYLFGLVRDEHLARRSRTRWRRPRRTAGRAPRRRGASRTSCGLRATVGPRTPRRRQGRMDPWQGQSALRHRLARRQRACARSLDKDLSCQRGEMENRIEECQLDLFADRTSAHCIRANQLRLWFASTAYAPLCARRRHVRKPAPQTAQDRRMGSYRRPPHRARKGHEPSLPGRVPHRPKTITRRRSLKRRTTRPSLQ